MPILPGARTPKPPGKTPAEQELLNATEEHDTLYADNENRFVPGMSDEDLAAESDKFDDLKLKRITSDARLISAGLNVAYEMMEEKS